jgi:hypothetical protein
MDQDEADALGIVDLDTADDELDGGVVLDLFSELLVK